MCGIAGLYFKDRHEDHLQLISEMTSALSHRGPDDEGIVSPTKSSNIFLGHRRLSIIDLSKLGHQPMVSQNGRFWLVYNGEIYNHKSLREALLKKGCQFKSTSDTEVLLNLFEQEGIDCLKKLQGMFAFAIWDDVDKRLLLARDGLGIKPLYYYFNPITGVFAFASEINSLLKCGQITTQVNQDAKLEFLRRGSIKAPNTIYTHIHALVPGEVVSYEKNNIRKVSFSSPVNVCAKKLLQFSLSEVAEKVRAALIESVKAHMVSDVPVGVFLSGGLDSAAIVAAVRSFYQGPLRTFTLVFPKTALDESATARMVARHFKTDHHEMTISYEDFRQLIPIFLKSMDQPTIDGLNTFVISKMAKRLGVKVVLSGLGGDEILGGYDSFVKVPRVLKGLKMLSLFPGLRQSLSWLIDKLPMAGAAKLQQVLKSDLSIKSVWQNCRAVFTDNQIKNMEDEVFDFKDACPSQDDRSALTEFDQVSLLEIERFMMPQLLRDSDNFSMANGIELRTPFVDNEFIQKVSAAGLWAREKGLSYKATLFQAMKEFLPKELFKVQKKGFVLPFDSWLGKMPEYRSLIPNQRYPLHWSRYWAMFVWRSFAAPQSEKSDSCKAAV